MGPFVVRGTEDEFELVEEDEFFPDSIPADGLDDGQLLTSVQSG